MTLTAEQLRALREAHARRIPYLAQGGSVIQCTACRDLFVDARAWKRHRAAGRCDTSTLLQVLDLWAVPHRVRVPTGSTPPAPELPEAAP